MRLSLPIIICFLFAQEAAFTQSGFEKIDARADTFGRSFTDAAELARQLTQPYQTEKEKARAIFTWVARNIRFDCEKFRRPEKVRFTAQTEAELKTEREKWEASQIRQTLRKKKGVSEDYSRLFKTMCEAAGLE
ncbi:MAG: transglutaminase-like domain-containing protein, partial [Thermoanaerobaculia bacterium]|nr:transglutaminase-like domain-containing protein [Thermoanaerobaculia bacterium]